jgi:Na+/proline symporter
MANWTWDYTMGAFWVVLIGRTLENLVPYTTDQSVVQRYLTTPTEKKAAQAVWLGVLMALPSSFLFFILGTALYAFYSAHPGELDPGLLKADAIFPLFIVEQIPPGITGLIIAAIFAASMSTLDSSLNSVSTVIVTDFYQRFVPDSSDRTRLRLARVLTVLLGIVGTGTALLMTMMDITSLWEQYMKYVGLFGGSLAGLFALGIFTKRANGTGALIGAATGAAVLVYVQQQTAVSFLLYSAIGISTSFIAGYFASLVVGRNRDLNGVTWWTRPHAGSERTP